MDMIRKARRDTILWDSNGLYKLVNLVSWSKRNEVKDLRFCDLEGVDSGVSLPHILEGKCVSSASSSRYGRLLGYSAAVPLRGVSCDGVL